jgi:hypothetical protein
MGRLNGRMHDKIFDPFVWWKSNRELNLRAKARLRMYLYKDLTGASLHKTSSLLTEKGRPLCAQSETNNVCGKHPKGSH